MFKGQGKRGIILCASQNSSCQYFNHDSFFSSRYIYTDSTLFNSALSVSDLDMIDISSSYLHKSGRKSHLKSLLIRVKFANIIAFCFESLL